MLLRISGFRIEEFTQKGAGDMNLFDKSVNNASNFTRNVVFEMWEL